MESGCCVTGAFCPQPTRWSKANGESTSLSRSESHNEDYDPGQDYTTALDAARPLTIERKLNEPSICQLWLSLPTNGSLATPSRNQSMSVTGDDGTHLLHRVILQ